MDGGEDMKLYGSEQSPFTARIWIACEAKGIALDQLALPEAGLQSAEFLAINPIGKLPVLLDGGVPIIESETILDYIDDCYPDPPLRPASAIDRVRMRTAIRIMDTYVMVPVSRLFAHLDPATRDAKVVQDEVRRWTQGMAWLAPFVPDAPQFLGDRLTLADCVLPPSFLLSRIISNILGIDDPIATHATLVGYRDKVRAHAPVAAALARIETALGSA